SSSAKPTRNASTAQCERPAWRRAQREMEMPLSLTLSPAYRGEGSWGLPLHIRPRIDRMFHRDLPDFCLVRFIQILGNDDLDDGKFIASFAVALDPATFDPHFRPAVGA